MATIHEGKKPSKCDICDAKFTAKQVMNGHIATVHEGKEPFKCDIYNANFGCFQSRCKASRSQ